MYVICIWQFFLFSLASVIWIPCAALRREGRAALVQCGSGCPCAASLRQTCAYGSARKTNDMFHSYTSIGFWGGPVAHKTNKIQIVCSTFWEHLVPPRNRKNIYFCLFLQAFWGGTRPPRNS